MARLCMTHVIAAVALLQEGRKKIYHFCGAPHATLANEIRADQIQLG